MQRTRNTSNVNINDLGTDVLYGILRQCRADGFMRQVCQKWRSMFDCTQITVSLDFICASPKLLCERIDMLYKDDPHTVTRECQQLFDKMRTGDTCQLDRCYTNCSVELAIAIIEGLCAQAARANDSVRREEIVAFLKKFYLHRVRECVHENETLLHTPFIKATARCGLIESLEGILGFGMLNTLDKDTGDELVKSAIEGDQVSVFEWMQRMNFNQCLSNYLSGFPPFVDITPNTMSWLLQNEIIPYAWRAAYFIYQYARMNTEVLNVLLDEEIEALLRPNSSSNASQFLDQRMMHMAIRSTKCMDWLAQRDLATRESVITTFVHHLKCEPPVIGLDMQACAQLIEWYGQLDDQRSVDANIREWFHIAFKEKAVGLLQQTAHKYDTGIGFTVAMYELCFAHACRDKQLLHLFFSHCTVKFKDLFVTRMLSDVDHSRLCGHMAVRCMPDALSYLIDVVTSDANATHETRRAFLTRLRESILPNIQNRGVRNWLESRLSQ